MNTFTLCVTYMGLESYLFYIKFKTPITENAAISMLEQAGMTFLDNKSQLQTEKIYGNLYFELRTNKGLTEANVSSFPGDTTVDELSLRFSILSPKSVIDQTFEFFQRLNDLSRIDVYDTEIRNHVMRQLRQTGRIDQDFKGLNIEDEDAINKLCLIALNVEDFKRNDFAIMKRQRILDNTEGEIIEGGSVTINLIEKKGVFDRFLGWIKKEL